MLAKLQVMKCIIENAGTNYSAYLDGLDGVVTTGQTIDEIKVRMQEAIAIYQECCREDGFPVPSITIDEYVLADE